MVFNTAGRYFFVVRCVVVPNYTVAPHTLMMVQRMMMITATKMMITWCENVLNVLKLSSYIYVYKVLCNAAIQGQSGTTTPTEESRSTQSTPLQLLIRQMDCCYSVCVQFFVYSLLLANYSAAETVCDVANIILSFEVMLYVQLYEIELIYLRSYTRNGMRSVQ